MNSSHLKVAVAQSAPNFMDLDRSVEKAVELIAQAGENEARLVAFPEAFLPGYPDWVWLVPNGEYALLNDLYEELVGNAVTIPGDATEALCQAARQAGIYIAMGVHEVNAEASGSTLYNTLLFIDDQGDLLGKHRKLIPTGGERLVWGQGDGSTLIAPKTSLGTLGGLLCWENFMPLARQAMYNAGSQIHIAPTWDSSEKWNTCMRHIAREGGMFVLNACQAVHIDDIPDRYDFKRLYPKDTQWINPGNSCIVDPYGEIIAGPLKERQEILYAEIDLGIIRRAKRMFDVAGHYSRPDVFGFEVKTG